MRYRPNKRPRSGETARFLRSREIYDVVRSQTREIANRARALAPVESGEYKAGIEVSYRYGFVDRHGDSRATGRVEATAPHSAAVEFGNRNADGQHILRRAAGGA